LEQAGAVVWEAQGADGRTDVRGTLARLCTERGVRRLLVEGGGVLHGTLFREGLADQVVALVSPRVLGGDGAPAPVDASGFGNLAGAPRLEEGTARPLGEDLLLRAYVVSG
jgi:diaminohydroxyphosphoribosylaminopyrimidine deaminase/5-amino-6-(5-phosphoribosylamino)uracil reductase